MQSFITHHSLIVHSNCVLDCRPRNILINKNCRIKIADFGLARIYNSSNDNSMPEMSGYVTTRWYRAPEIIVGWSYYTSAVDMWAVGCVIAELYARMPLFPGRDSHLQLDVILRCLGAPSPEYTRKIQKPSYK